MRKPVKQFIQLIAETLPLLEPIYDFGSLQTPGQENVADLRPIFPEKTYIGADMRDGPGVDVILNLHQINLPANTAGTVFILGTLEHVEYPRKAISEAYRILKSDGILVMSSAMYFPIHAYPNDYWRFTPEGFKSLLKEFSQQFVFAAGESYFPHIVTGIGAKTPLPQTIIEQFLTAMHSRKPLKYLKGQTRSYTPPIVWSWYRKLAALYYGQ